MKWITETIGILLCIQGIGGLINSLTDGSRSWFLVRYVVPDHLQVPAAVLLALLGGAILTAGARSRQET